MCMFWQEIHHAIENQNNNDPYIISYDQVFGDDKYLEQPFHVHVVPCAGSSVAVMSR